MSATIAQYLVSALIDEGFKRLYCLPGYQNDDFFDVLYDHQDLLTPVHTRHEQGAAFMALGAAMATGLPQVCCVVPGPGLLNASAAIATAWGVEAPVLMIVGQTPAATYGMEIGELHEIPDQLAILRQFSKISMRIDDPTQATRQIAEAMAALRSGRAQPVSIEIPMDMWQQQVSPVEPSLKSVSEPSATITEIKTVVDKIDQSSQPMVVIGEGAQGCGQEVLSFANLIGAPIISCEKARSIVNTTSPLFLLPAVGRELWKQADLIIGLGCRIGKQLAVWESSLDLCSIHIDIDAQELLRGHAADIQINADIKTALPVLMTALGPQPNRLQWECIVNQTRNQLMEKFNVELAPQAEYLSAIRSALPDNGVLIVDLTQIGYAAEIMYAPPNPRTYLSFGFQGTLGWSIPVALGASDALPSTPVVAVCGDGGALYNIQELATAKLHHIPVTIIIFNDNCFGNVRRFQIEKFGNRVIATDLFNPDFVELANSYGVQAYRATGPTELAEYLAETTVAEEPCLITVDVGEFPSPWPFM